MGHTKKILVAPLNWGLGHASRCIPVIWELQKQGAEVILASEGRALELLRAEFTSLPALEMPPYGITYHSGNMVVNMAWQLPKILLAIYREHCLTQKLIARHHIRGIISDNRFGCFSKKVPCVFLTHQLNIRAPWSGLSRAVNFFNHHFIRKYNTCWVPDTESEPNLSGALSHGSFRGEKHYIGALSRMQFFETKKEYDAIVVLSGPEPQRSHLEKAIIAQAANLPWRFLLVQGRAELQSRFFIKKNIEVVSHLRSEELNRAILASQVFIGRPGYSTIMDLAKLGTHALLIPTPGQTEQEYLAEKCRREKAFLIQNQKTLDVAKALAELPHFSGLQGNYFDEKQLAKAVSGFLEAC